MSFKVEAIDQVLGEAVVELGYTFLKQEQKQAILAFLQGREVCGAPNRIWKEPVLYMPAFCF